MELRVQLKICEGCGCLWYRPVSLTSSSYCQGCQIRLKDFPVNTSLSRKAARRGSFTPRPSLMGAWMAAEDSGGAA